jgi:hypothetical protein
VFFTSLNTLGHLSYIRAVLGPLFKEFAEIIIGGKFNFRLYGSGLVGDQ